MKDPHPPKWATGFLKWYCRREMLEDLEGDLYEYYLRNLEHSKSRADLIYIIDVFKFIRPYMIKKFNMKRTFADFTMSKNFVKTSFRNLSRNKLFSSINIMGLSVSMTIGLIMIALIYELTTYDNFHIYGDRMYRLNSVYESSRDRPVELATSSILMGEKLRENYPGIDHLVTINRRLSGDAKKGSNIIPVRGMYASEDFFKLFSFKLISGNSETVLSEPYSIVITETLAEKLFDSDPIGETNELGDSQEYLVSGIVEDPPYNSHIQFEAIGSLLTLYVQEAGNANSRFLNWTNIWNNYVYFSLTDKTTTDPLKTVLATISKEENANLENVTITQNIQAFKDIMPGKNLSNQMGPSMDYMIIWFILILALVVILSACFNYTNLSIAKSMKRAKEVGIRKVMGASRLQVFGLFTTEAIITSMCSLVIAIFLFFWVKPHFLSIGGDELTGLVHLGTPAFLFLYFIGFALLTGLLAGFIPSVIMARIQSLLVLKDASKIRLFRGVQLRKALVVLQFTISLIFIIASIGIYRQYKHALHFNLGFSTENIINIDLYGNNPEVAKSKLKEVPGVENISRSSMIHSTGDVYSLYGKYKDPTDSAKIAYNSVDEQYIPLHELTVLSGHNFRPAEEAVEESSIVNMELLRRFGLSDPESALQEQLTLDGRTYRITGVVADFHHQTVSSPISPFVFLYNSDGWSYVNAKVDQASAVNLDQLEAVWKEIDPVHPFRAALYDDLIKEAYGEYAAFAQIVGVLALLAILIAALGLLGMAVYTTETRTREIGIRKVMGATEFNLMFLLSKGYLILLAIAALIAIPLAVIWLNQIFSSIVYGVGSPIPEVLLGTAIILGLGIMIIGSRTFLAARRNPADILKYE